MLASTIQQPNNHKKTNTTPPPDKPDNRTTGKPDYRLPDSRTTRWWAPDSSGPNSVPPDPPPNTRGGPAPDARAHRTFHTHRPCEQDPTGSTSHGRPHQRGQHVDDSTSKHPTAGRTDAYRATGVCSLERR